MALLDTPQPDLTLEELRFLVTLAQTQSLTTAASRHGLSMGSASRRLARLREVFEDELFVRSGMQMLPTQRMRELLPRISKLLSTSRSLFCDEEFDLENTRRTVRILAVDNAVMTILKDVFGRLAHSAPHASIEIIPVNDGMLEHLRSGRADLAIYPLRNVPKDFHSLELYRSRRGVLVRDRHPLIDLYTEKGRLTLEDLQAYRSVTINFSGAPEHITQAASGQQNFETAVSMPYFLGVPYALMQTDYVFTAPVLTLMHFLRVEQFNLRMLPAPQEISAFSPSLVWHHGTQTDPFMQWIRGVITNCARAEAKRLGAMEAAD
ncbi:LysR family transcriptional regulator [Sutterella sp.]|uniref:LysR family transcriptional regulator n=1 Tax=Sutterella sp. TaxID=1981025 RepID=UPI0026DFD165|nr:LysR family transcriptional regulator [Sutterella sp.]MDO5533003.1 LysR family transcriptional regulator [Sutterella sp.]